MDTAEEATIVSSSMDVLNLEERHQCLLESGEAVDVSRFGGLIDLDPQARSDVCQAKDCTIRSKKQTRGDEFASRYARKLRPAPTCYCCKSGQRRHARYRWFGDDK